LKHDVKIILRNPADHKDLLDYNITANGTELSRDWLWALERDLLRPGLKLDKSFCFLGFPYTHRDLDYLCNELNQHIWNLNEFNATGVWQAAGLESYVIEEWFSPDSVRFSPTHTTLTSAGTPGDEATTLGLRLKHDIMNRLHNHFERLQGTVWAPSSYYALANERVKLAIRSLNLLCHEIESLVLSQRKLVQAPEWVRPSQITSWISAPRHDLTDTHRAQFDCGYNRYLGEVYMHWCQIGKTLMEVYNDEGAPDLNVGDDPTDITVGAGTTCEAINALRYYSGEFDIEWGNSVTYADHPWHTKHVNGFYAWLERNKVDVSNPKLSLGHLPIGMVDLSGSFATTDYNTIWQMIGSHLDIYRIETAHASATYDA